MALASSGQIKMSEINTELGVSSTTANTSLKNQSNGTVATINTNSSDRPDGSSPHQISEFYGYNHSASGGGPSVGTYGNSNNTILFSGNQGTGLVTVTDQDFSSADYAGETVVGATGHIYVRYESGTSFRNDPQVTEITCGSDSFKNFSSTGVTGIQTTYRTTNSTYSHSASFSQVYIATSPAGRWYRRNGTPPSGGTGVNADAIYYEGSSGAYSKDVYLRFPEITFTSDNVTFKGYGYGSNMGTLYMGIYITG